MSKWRVELATRQSYMVTVEAETQEDAEGLAKEKVCDGEWDLMYDPNLDYGDLSVTEVEEVGDDEEQELRPRNGFLSSTPP